MKFVIIKIWSGIKNILKPFIRIFFIFSPQFVIESLVKIRPELVFYIPKNRKFIFRKYLGDISVNIDAVYRIERTMLNGYYDKEALFVMNKFVSNGDICFDIGANVGPISFMQVKNVGSSGKVFAFEPGPFLFKRLTDNIKLNPSYEQNMKAYQIGFSDQINTLTWNEDIENRGNAGFLFQQPNQEVKMKMDTVDHFCKENGIHEVHFIKIDVEGMEYDVLQGAMNTIIAYKPVIYYETGFYEKGFWAETQRGESVILFIEQMLEKVGYKFYKVDNGQIKEVRYPDLGYNTLAINGQKDMTR